MSRRPGKTYFTESDDDNLTKYIAKVKPVNSGRLGNNIYISLEESGGLRPWAKRHSWQSWRERYKKNQDWFDHQIKKYQKKLKEGTSEKQNKTEDRGELYEELFGVSQISEDSGDESDVPKRSQDPSSIDGGVKIETPVLPPVQEPASKPVISSEQKSSAAAAATALKPPQILEDGGGESDVHNKLSAPSSDDVVKIETVPPAQVPTSKPAISSEQKPSDAAAAIALKPPQHIRAKSKKIASRDDDSNFFGTPSHSPSPSLPVANSTTPRGEPPALTQGFYRSSFKRPRAAFGNVTNDESWPPKRRKIMAKDSDVNPDVDMSDAFGKVETNKAVPASLPAEGSANGLTRVRPPAQVNAVASSSKVLLSSPPHSPVKPTNLLKVIYAKGNPSSDTSHVHNDAPSLPKKATQNTNLAKKNHNGVLSSRKPVSIKSVQRLISSPDDDVDHQLARLSPMDVDDPFIANKHNTTSPVRNFILPPRRIDLRKSLDNATRRRRSRTSTTTSSTSRHSNPSFLLPEDRKIFNQVGLQKVMAVIAKNYGFDVDVATKAFFATKSIEKTKSLLKFAKEVTNSATSALLSELVHDSDIDSSDDDEEAPQYMRRGHNNSSPPSGKDRQKSDALTNSGRQKAKRSSGGSRRKSNQLSIKPRTLDEEIDEMVLSDYSPPRVSRAGQFLRLVKEGRREEAVDRERRRASGAFVIETQTQAQRYDDETDEDQQTQSSLSSSPTHSSPRQEPAVNSVDTPNVDSFQPPIVAPHKEDIVVQQHHDQPPDDNITLPAVDDVDDNEQRQHRTFFKRISEGQSSLNEDEDDPEVLKLANEHRDMIMNVMEDDADALRLFEQKHNQDLLRLWSLDWARQKIADM